MPCASFALSKPSWGNSQRGFQAWLSPDGVNWIPAGESTFHLRRNGFGFRRNYPRPAEIYYDAVFAAAYDSQAAR
jgi:hypothetical protein